MECWIGRRPVAENPLIAVAKQEAVACNLDPALFCAVIEQESSWNPWAMRYEPGFFAKYIDGKITAGETEKRARATSWGLCQVMGQVAREYFFTEKFLSQLCDPQSGLRVGAQVLAGKLRKAGGDIEKGLLLWNGGANKNYPSEVLARMVRYQ